MCVQAKIMLAAAGAGKTTYLVQEALSHPEKRILITTYTNSNRKEIICKFIEEVGRVPVNVTIQTWYSFLLSEGARPYQGKFRIRLPYRIEGLNFIDEGKVSQTFIERRRYYRKTSIKYYMDSSYRLYSDRLANFVAFLESDSSGLVVNRIARIYDYVFIDEIQDFSGYSLEVICLLIKKCQRVLMVGDLRQVAYQTDRGGINKKYRYGNILPYFRTKKGISVIEDYATLAGSYRCVQAICDYANLLFPNFEASYSNNNHKSGHDGVFFVKETDVHAYVEKFSPQVLRLKSDAKLLMKHSDVLNFGQSKGLGFPRVLIYWPETAREWIWDHSIKISDLTRNKLYIAITRARQSVAIVVPNNAPLPQETFYTPEKVQG